MPPKKRASRSSRRTAKPAEEEPMETEEEAGSEEAASAEEPEAVTASAEVTDDAAEAEVATPEEESDKAAKRKEDSDNEEETPAPKKRKEEEKKEEEVDEKEEDAEKEKEEVEEEKNEEEEKKKEEEEERKKKEEEELKKKEEEDKAKEEERKREAKEQRERERAEKRRQEEDEELKKELAKYWKTVKDDPADFTGWTYLLQFVDGKNCLVPGREAYNSFLERYPYCYGYWKKFADFEKRNGTPERVMEVFNAGTKAIPLSVDLWLHYLNHVKAASETKDNIEFIRQQYELAVEACGREWRSDKLWDHYVKFETEQKNWTGMYKLYDRILRSATQGLMNNFDKFREFIKEHHPKELMTTTEFLALRKEILADMKDDKEGDKEGDEDDEEKKKKKGLEEGSAVPGEEGADFVQSDEETMAMRERLIFTMRKTFKETEEQVNTRWRFEEQIKRPYFHVKPLERAQLKNWHEYLEFMKEKYAKGNGAVEVEILYERCLIACALYEEFWMNYISWLESWEDSFKKTEKLRNAFTRACTSHLPAKIDIHARWAAFEETAGDSDKAVSILEALEQAHPQLVSLQLRRINVERRRGKSEKAVELYEACIKAATQEDLAGDLSIKFARFLRLHLHRTEQAKEVINKALEANPKNVKLYLQMLDILLHSEPIDMEAVEELFDKAMAQEFKLFKHNYLFSQRKVEFLEDFATDIKKLQAAQKAHVEMTKKMRQNLDKDMAIEEEEYGKAAAAKTAAAAVTAPSSNGAAASQSFPPIANSSSYTAQQTQAYTTNASRYATYPTGYNYGPYYQGYGGYGGSGY